MHFFIIGSIGLSIGYVLFVILRQLVRWRRSYTLIWPVHAGQREQARICRKYLARAGIVNDGLMWGARTFDLIYRTPHNRINICFASQYHRVTASMLADMNGAVSTDPKKIPVLIAHPRFATQEAIALARRAQIALLRPSDLAALRDLIKAGRRISREQVLELSQKAFDRKTE